MSALSRSPLHTDSLTWGRCLAMSRVSHSTSTTRADRGPQREVEPRLRDRRVQRRALGERHRTTGARPGVWMGELLPTDALIELVVWHGLSVGKCGRVL